MIDEKWLRVNSLRAFAVSLERQGHASTAAEVRAKADEIESGETEQ